MTGTRVLLIGNFFRFASPLRPRRLLQRGHAGLEGRLAAGRAPRPQTKVIRPERFYSPKQELPRSQAWQMSDARVVRENPRRCNSASDSLDNCS